MWARSPSVDAILLKPGKIFAENGPAMERPHGYGYEILATATPHSFNRSCHRIVASRTLDGTG